MKEYIKPELTIEIIYIEDVITSSFLGEADIDGGSTTFIPSWNK